VNSDTPNAVVFDLGKVLLDFDYSAPAKRLAARSTINETQLYELVAASNAMADYEAGLITTEAFYKCIQKGSGFTGDLQEFSAIFSDIFTPIHDMIALHSRIREIGLPTFIFSNTNELAVRHVRETYPFFADFSGYVFSFEEKSMKPAAPVYEAVEKMTGCSGSELLYIDDRPENADAGAARGWRTVQHVSPEETRRRVREWIAL
jgi:FMN phosphatase YigB (HAD superfamily)